MSWSPLTSVSTGSPPRSPLGFGCGENRACQGSLWPRDGLWDQFFLRGQTSVASVEGSRGTGVEDWAGPGRSWEEPEGKVLGGPQGRQRQLWLSEFSQPLSLPSLQCLLTHKAFLRNGGPQKAPFETSDSRVFWSSDFSETQTPLRMCSKLWHCT